MSLLVYFVAYVAIMWVALKLRLLPGILCQAWFAGTFVLMLLITGALCFVWHHLLPLFGFKKQKVEDICVGTGWVTYNYCLLFWNPQIVIQWADPQHYEDMKKLPKKAAFMANHMSNLDPFLATACCPLDIVSTSRSYFKGSLIKIPVFKWYFVGANHFPVYFVSKNDGEFSTNKVKQAKTSERVNVHVKRGGRIAMYPEGAVNKTPHLGLQSFRHGAFDTAAEHKMPLAMMVFSGVEDAWPVKSMIGGLPADIFVSFTLFHCEYEKEEPKAMSERMQAIMQSEYDKLLKLKTAVKKTKSA